MRCIPHFLIAFFLFAASGFGQTIRHPGVELYNRGNYKAAVSSLEAATSTPEFKSNAGIWNFLGLAYLETGQPKKAVAALEKAVSIQPSNATFLINLAYVHGQMRKMGKAMSLITEAIKLNPKLASSYYLRGGWYLLSHKWDQAKSDADKVIELEPALERGYLLRSNIEIALIGIRLNGSGGLKGRAALFDPPIAILNTGIERCNEPTACDKLKLRLDLLKTFQDYAKDEPSSENEAQAQVEPLTLTKKRPPSYTDTARQAGIKGTIRLAVVFGADGNIQGVLPLATLGFGLDEQAIAAAWKIEFVPKKVNGSPVSTLRIVEYSFDIY